MDKNVIVGAAGLEISLGYSGNLLNISQSGSSIDFALDEWSIEINGQLISIKTLDLRSVHENGTSAEFIYEGSNDLVIELRWTVHNSSGNVYALREVSVRMPGNFQVGFIKSHIRTSQLPTLASQIRTFSDAPFAQVVNKGELYRVMATVVDIVKDGIEKMVQDGYPIKVILFKPEKEKETATGFKMTDQRAKLYMAYIKQNMDMVYSVRQKGDQIEVILK